MEIEANRLSITVDDLGSGLWSGRVKQELEARTPLRNVLFSPSPSRPAVSVDELPIRFLDARSDTHLTRLRQLSHSPAAWFRSPFVLLVLVSCPDYEEYKRDLRLRLRAMADTETQAAGQPELLFVYVRPAGSDAAAKGPARVFEAMRKDLNKAKKERCVRLDPAVPASTEVSAPAVLGLEEFDRQARDALRAAFKARAAAYAEEVRRLMLSRLDPAWSFSTLYLVKDGLAAMLEAAGLADDALREYSELEACYLEVHSSSNGRPGQQQVQAFGGKAAGDDEAALLWSPWHATRQAASQPEAPPQFLMRQALFANQARLLIKLHRHAEVAERGLNFIRSFGALLAQQERQGGAPPQLREAWCFASYLSLAEATSRLQAARVEERRKTDHGGRGGARRGRLSEAAAPGTPHSSSATSPPPQAWEWDSAAQRPVPSPRVASPVLGASAAHHGKAKQGAAAQGEAGASPQAAAAGGSGRQGPQVNWQLGVLPSSRSATANGTAAAAAGQGGAAEGVPPSGRSTPGGVGHVAAPGTAALYCLLAKLYCAARSELLRLGLAAGLELPDCAAAAGMRAAPHNAAAAAAATVEATDTQQAAAAALVPPSSNVHLAPAPLAGGPPASSDLATVDLGSSVAAGGQRQGSLQATAADGLPSQVPDSAAVEAAEQEAPLEASSEASQQEQLQLQRAAGAAPGNVPQLTLRSKAPAGDGDSPSSSPRSTSTHQSAATPRRERESARSLPAAASAASLGASEAAAPAAPAPSSARTEQNDLRSVERQVAAALAERATRSAGGHLHAPKAALPAEAAAGAGGASLPPWLVHWRLRTALSSQQLFIELFMELSQAAASCYARCGHLRSAALLRADVADALAKQGSLQKAAELYEQQCRCYLREGWLVLAAAALPKLAACQLACGSLGLAHTAAALLSLPEPFRGTPAERHAACQLLRQAAAATEGMTGCRPLLPTSPLLAGAALPEAAVSLSAAIAAAPLKASISRFFGRSSSGSDGGAVLAPPPGAAGSGGALAAAVGDVVAVQLLLDNQLPEALLLRGVTLTLVVLQEMTVIHSPRASASPVLVLGSALKQARSSISAAGTPLRDQLSLPPNSVALESQDSVGKERYESQWQQVEELHCPLVSITAPPAAGGTHSGDEGAPDSGGGGSHERLQPMSNEVLLPPRPSLLTFLAAPVKRGLYKAVHLRAVLDQLPVHVAIQAPKPLWQPGATAGGTAGGTTGDGSAASSRRRSRADTAAGGTPLAAELPHSSPALGDAIVMQVVQARPRVQLRLLAAGGSLIAGQEQWLGVALDPQQDSLHSAQLELTWPLGPLGQPGSGALQGAGLSRLQPKGSRLGPHHRAAHSHGGDMRLGGGSSYAALSTSLTAPPFVRPEHRTAVLLPAAVPRSAGTADGSDTGSSRAGSSQVAELLAAEGPASAASAWLMADGLQQLLALPLIQEGHAVNLWWRVTAGEVAAPPEQVHISPPAPRHSIRPHDVRWMGGPAEASPPAAVLDVPLTLEYSSGCQRSHSRVLGAAVRQPFSVSTLARELPSGGVAVQVTLTSNMGVPAQLSRLSLQPQPGFNVTANLLDSMGLLPANLAPFASLAASFLLATDPSAAPGADFTLLPSSKLQPSALCIDYTIDSRQQCGVAAAPVTAGAAATSVERGSPRAVVQGSSRAAADSAPCQTPGLAVLEQLDASGRQRSGSPVGSPTKRSSSPTATAGEDDEEVEGGAGRQHCLFRHLLTLEMPASKQDASGALVYVRQLGPFVATVAEATTLCWRLERSGCCDPQQPATRISFEVAAEGDHWRPQGRRHGSVTLAGHEGAVATVEATWVPLAAGTLPVPTLRLQDVSYQEVFDVGLSLSGSNAITVVDRY